MEKVHSKGKCHNIEVIANLKVIPVTAIYKFLGKLHILIRVYMTAISR